MKKHLLSKVIIGLFTACTFLSASSQISPNNYAEVHHHHHHHHHVHTHDHAHHLAENESTIYTFKDRTIASNESLSVPISAKNITCTGLEIEIRYDTKCFNSGNSFYNSVEINSPAGDLFDYSISTPGVVKATYLFKKNKLLNGQLFSFYLNTLRLDKDVKTYIDVMVGYVINESMANIPVKATGGYVNIKKTEPTIQTSYDYAQINKESYYKDEEILYSLDHKYNSSYKMGEIKIEYDKNLLELIECKKGAYLTKATCDVNTSIKGVIFISFVSNDLITNYQDLVDVRFKVLQDTNVASKIKTTLSNLYINDYDYCTSSVNDCNFIINKAPVEVVKPSIYLTNKNVDSALDFNIDLFIDANANLGAVDLVLNFDPTYLTLVRCNKETIDGMMLNFNEKDKDTGKILISILSTSGINIASKLASFTFKAVNNETEATTIVSLQADAFYDPLTKPIEILTKNSTVSIAKHLHTYGDWVITKQPTCTINGERKRTCSSCGNEIVEEIQAPGHKLGEWQIDIEPTCDHPGRRSRHCENCEYVETEEIKQNEHIFSEWSVKKEATCTEDGIEHRICSLCNKEETKVIPALGHNYQEEWTIDKEATCTETGLKSHHCSRCDSKKDETIIPLAPHKEATRKEDVILSTCTEEGSYTLVTYCETCGKVISKVQKTIPLAAHDYGDWVVIREATSATKGLEQRTCNTCGATETREIDYKPHRYSDEWTIDIEATCEHPGEKSHHCLDPDCDSRIDITVIPQLEHNLLTRKDIVKEATCTEKGSYNLVTYCSLCGKVMSSVEHEIPLAAHNFGEWEVIQQPTSATKGIEKRVCKDCGAFETREIDLVPHRFSPDWTIDIEATCEHPGEKSHHCLDPDCDARSDITIIPQLQHTLETRVENRVEPTCTTKGSYDLVTYCSVCGKVTNTKKVSINATGHKYGEWITIVEPTCTNDGTRHRICETCGHEEVEKINKLAHNWSTSWTIDKEATCDAPGSKSHHCLTCGARKDVTVIPKLEHILATRKEFISDATCTTKGSYDEVTYCTLCGKVTNRVHKEIPLLAHTFGEWTIVKEATATESGLEHRICSVCGFEETRLTESTGHHWSTEWSIDKAPTCSEFGIKSHHCTDPGCDARKDITQIDKLPHNIEIKTETIRNSSCTEEGLYYKIEYCIICGEEISRVIESNPKFSHTWGEWVTTVEPTCTTNGSKERVCSVCGTKETQIIQAHGHQFNPEWTIDKDATCTEAGERSHHCLFCDERDQIEIISPYGHDFGDWIEDRAPTCSAPGKSHRICRVCGEVEYMEYPPTSHTWDTEWTIDKAPTCTEFGSKSHHCLVCGEKTDITQIDKLPHSEVTRKEIITEATCTQTGSYDLVTYCSVCGKEIKRVHKVSPMIIHTFGEWQTTIQPTCTEKGTQRRVCSVCGTVEVRNIAANGHTWKEEWTIDKAATCSEYGEKSHHCSVCDARKDVTRIEKLPHTTTTRKEIIRESTCTQEGSYDIVTYCSVCNKVISRRTYTSPLIAHTWGEWTPTGTTQCGDPYVQERTCKVCGAKETRLLDEKAHNWDTEWTIDRAPTCSMAGEKSHHCKDCDARKDITPIEKTEHVLITREELIAPPTCETVGVVDVVTYCDVCGQEISRETKYLPKAVHEYGEWQLIVDATCTTIGYEERTCLVCGAKETRIIEAIGHVWDENWTVDVETSCGHAGSKSHHCINCDAKKDVTEIPKLEHTLAERYFVTKDPTCTDYGLGNIEIYCEICGEVIDVLVDAYVIPKAEHTFSEWTNKVEPTCTTAGVEHRTCTYCGYEEVRPIDPLGHNFQLEWTIDKQATCTEEGQRSHHCGICGAKTDIEVIPKLPHQNATRIEEISDATCTERGQYYEIEYCTVCNEIISKTLKYRPITEHTFGEWVVITNPTCTEDGVEQRVCSKCGFKETRTISNFGGHLPDPEWYVKKQATCSETGIKVQRCSRCGIILDTAVIEKIPHNYGVWTVEVAATCTTEGRSSRTCNVCGEKEYRVDEALEHNYSSDWTIDVEATCGHVGSKSHHCTRCGEKTDVTEIPKLEHAIGIDRTIIVKEPTCTEVGQARIEHYCPECGDVLQTLYVELPIIEHSFSDWTTKIPPTCTSEGVSHRICSVCGYEETKSLPKLLHEYSSSWTIDKEATCLEAGSKSHHCIYCDAKKDITVINKLDHITAIRKEIITPSTCTSEGQYNEVTYCSVCGTVLNTVTKTSPKLAHNFGDWTVIKEATAETEGLERRTCSVCGHYEERITTAKGHNWDTEWTIDKAPTCTEFGSKSHHCLDPDCNAKKDVTPIDKIAHDFGAWEVTEKATCIKEGVETRTCKVCGATETRKVSKTEHTYDLSHWVIDVEATCSHTGEKSHHCSVCDARTDVTIIEKLPHPTPYLTRKEITKEATCTQEGSYDLVSYCGTCGEVISRESHVIPKKSHSFGEWEVKTPATCIENGVEHRICQDCGYEEVRSTPKVAHTYELDWTIDKPATCKEAGEKSHHCSVCGERKDITIIPKLSHTIATRTEVISSATCTERGQYYEITYCSVCNEIISKVVKYNPIIPHTFGEWKTVIKETCTTNGLQERVCSKCGFKETKVINATGHKYLDNWVVVKDSTCTEVGQEKRTCEYCGSEEFREIPAKGHDFSESYTIDKPATCSSKGEKSQHCSRCDARRNITPIDELPHTLLVREEIINQPQCNKTGEGVRITYCSVCHKEINRETFIIPAIVHNFGEWTVTKEPTCTELGSKQRECKECHEIEIVPIDPLGHDWSNEWTIDVEATCGHTGSKSHHCTRCGAKKDITEIEKLPHGEILERLTVIQESTCTEPGAYLYERYCSICGEVIESSHRVMEPEAHKFSYWKVKTPATCTSEGIEERECFTCHTIETRVIPKTEHIADIEWYIEKASTCTETGIKVKRCSVCGAILETQIIEKLPHSMGDWKIVIEATCTTNGLKERVCSECGYKETEVINALGHSYSPEWIIDVEATCGHVGSKSHHCTRCGEKTDVTVIPKLEHTIGADRIIIVKAPTCTEVGQARREYYCPECGEILQTLFEELPMIEHNFGSWEVVKEATCTEYGVEKHICSVCGYLETRPIEPKGHHWDNKYTIDKAPTCSEFGSKSIHCLDCEERQDVTQIDKLPHNQATRVEIIKPATCTTKGDSIIITYCPNCGEILKEEHKELPIIAHSYGAWQETVKPTCTTDGRRERICEICGHVEYEIIDALGHDISSNWTIDIEATCDHEGQRSHHCSRCDYKQDIEVINKLPHQIATKTEIIKEATCTEKGIYYEITYCSVCNTEISRTIKYLNIIPHEFSEWKVSKIPTCLHEGEEIRTCSLCGKTETRTIDIVDHKFSDQWTIDKAPTCSEYGEKSHHCLEPGCNERADITQIEKLPHEKGVLRVIIIKEATCTSKGQVRKEYYCPSCGEIISSTIEDIAPLSHSFSEWTIKVEPTCTTSGVEHRTCSICGYEEVRTIDALGHDWLEEWTIDIEATCDHEGSKSHHCSRCGEKTDITVIPKLEHTLVTRTEEIKPSTCTEQGQYYEITYCEVCGIEISRTIKYNEVLSHTFGDWKVVIEPTCTTNGLEERICDDCGFKETRVIEALGHDYSTSWTIDIEATCGHEGSKSHHCTRCGAKADITEIAKLPHARIQQRIIIIQDSTCTEFGTGLCENYCAECGEVVESFSVVIEQKAHIFGDWVVKTPATCTKEGVEERTCSVCGAKEYRDIEPLGHDYSTSWTIDIEATCDHEGSKSHHCSRCGEKTDVTIIPKLEHTLAIRTEEIKPSTCTEQGQYYEITYCSVCNKEISRSLKYTPIISHNLGDWIVISEATCTKQGFEERVCSECGFKEIRIIEPKGHNIDSNWTIDIEATCDHEGSKSHHCKDCDYVTDVTIIDKLPHSLTTRDELISSPTCEAEGSYKTITYCEVCGTIIDSEIHTIEKLPHTLTEAIKEEVIEPTCTKDGSYKLNIYCKECGKLISSETIVLAKLGHTLGEMVIENKVEPTCQNEGSYEEVVYCSICNEEISRTKVIIPKTEHTFSEWVKIKDPTLDFEGLEERICSVCGEKETRTIPRKSYAEAFKEAVLDIKLEDSFEVKLEKIKKAFDLYQKVENKEEISYYYTILEQYVKDYNEQASTLNDSNSEASNIIIKMIMPTAVLTLLGAALLKLKRRY